MERTALSLECLELLIDGMQQLKYISIYDLQFSILIDGNLESYNIPI